MTHTSRAPAERSDAELVARVRAGDETAFATLVERHQARLHRRCRRLLGDVGAEDAVQQTFLRALQALRDGAEVRRVEPWLHRIARNVALDETAARRNGEQELSEELVDRRGCDVLDGRADLRAALQAVAGLTTRQRSVLLGAVRGESHTEIAARLGVTEVSARQILARARATVRAAVGAWVPTPLMWLSRRVGAVAQRLPVASPTIEPFIPRVAAAVVAVGAIAAPAGFVVLHARDHDRDRPALAAYRDPTAVGPDLDIALLGLPGSHPARTFAALVRAAGQPADGRLVLSDSRRGRADVTPGPLGGRSAAGQSGSAAGSANQSATDATAMTSDPGAVDLSSGDPSATDPSATDPNATDPSATDSSATDPSATDPSASDPSAAGPTTTDASATDPTATAPSATDPTVTDPTATNPTATDPTVTAPAATTDTTVTDPTVAAP